MVIGVAVSHLQDLAPVALVQLEDWIEPRDARAVDQQFEAAMR
jgi:hypothetical protein